MPRQLAATAPLTSALAALTASMLSSVRLFGLLTSRMSHAGNANASATAHVSWVADLRLIVIIAPPLKAYAGGERKALWNRHLPTVRCIEEIAIQTGSTGAAIAPSAERQLRIHALELVTDPEREVTRTGAERHAGKSVTLD